MLKLIVLIILPSICYGQADIRDLMFFPEAKSFLGMTTASQSNTSYDISTDFNIYEFNRTGVSQQLTYVFERGRSINLALAQGNSTLEIDEDEYKSSGMQNPAISYRHRLKWQDTYGYNIDIEAGFSPSSNKRETATANKAGTIARGKQVIGAQLTIGKKYEMTQWNLSATARLNGEYEATDAENGNKTTADANRDFFFEYNCQTTINYNFSYILGAYYNIFSPITYVEEGGTERLIKAHGIPGLTGSILYAFTPNFMLSGKYSFSLGSTIEAEQDGSSFEYENYYENSLEVSATYLF